MNRYAESDGGEHFEAPHSAHWRRPEVASVLACVAVWALLWVAAVIAVFVPLGYLARTPSVALTERVEIAAEPVSESSPRLPVSEIEPELQAEARLIGPY
jgi:hypothetical protein